MIKENQKNLNRLLVLIDAIIVFASLLFAWYIRFQSGIIPVNSGHLSFEAYIKPIILLIPLYLVLFQVFGLYNPHRMKSIIDEFVNIFKAGFVGLLIFILVLYIIKNVDYSRYLLFIFGINSVLLVTAERTVVRFILRYYRKKGYNLKHVVVLGNSSHTVELLNLMEKYKHWGYNIVGILDDKSEKGTKIGNSEVIGKISEMGNVLRNINIDEVFITLDISDYNMLGEIINNCEKMGIRTQIIPDYYKYIPARPYVEEVDGIPIINIRYVPLDNMINKYIKRLFDIIVSIISIIVFSPVMLITVLIIKITSPGPILFKQERVGLNKRLFMMYKFRSMRVQKAEEEKVQWTTKDDLRKTKFGNFIRKTSIDELPQLFNVLKGDMSLIGPRPERQYFVDKFKEEIPKYMLKHLVRPGITGWAQVNGWRGDTSIEKRIDCDIYYIENWSFWLDVKIMFLTVFKGFINKNAY